MEEIREKIVKCKVICLDEMNLDPISTNPKYMKPKEKQKLINLVEEKMKLDINIINEEFNKVVLNSVLCEGNDFTKYPVYVDNRIPQQQEKIDSEKDDISVELSKDRTLERTDIAGNVVPSS
jgi:hypothetical protein